MKKRADTRIKRRFLVRFRIESSKKSYKWDIVTVRDLSAIGISFNYDKRIPLYTPLEFNITLPTVKESIHCKGMVCRVGKVTSHRKDIRRRPIYDIFTAFTEIERDKENIIETLAKNFL